MNGGNITVITLPFPPSVNHYWRHAIIGQFVRTLISADGRKYKQNVKSAVKAQRKAYGIAGNVAIHVTLFPPDRRRRDVDNYAKALLDGLVEAEVLVDDSQVRDLHLVWGAQKHGGLAAVTIEKLPESAEQGRLLA